MTRQGIGSRRGHTPLRLGIAIVASTMLAYVCAAPTDPIFEGDWLDPVTGKVAVVPPAIPVIFSGPDGVLGTADDIVVEALLGDLDLVVRAGVRSFTGPVPDPDPNLAATPAENGLGTEIDVVVSAVSGLDPDPLASPIFSPAIEGNPVLVVAFADLDADGRIGPTLSDGDPTDLEIEEMELEPIAMQMLTVENGQATGRLRLLVGGPSSHPVKVLIAAAAYSGSPNPNLYGGSVPIGPSVVTQIPFFPPFSPDGVLDAGPNGPELPSPTRPLGIELTPAFEPDPSDPVWGERFALRVDGSEISVDVVGSTSGNLSRFGVGLSARTEHYFASTRRVVRLGIDEFEQPHPFEIAERIYIPDDGLLSAVTAVVLPLDRLGNITDLVAAETVTLSTGGIVAILSPDVDGDPYFEILQITSAAGTPILLGDTGGDFDDPPSDYLIVSTNSAQAAGSIIDLLLPDPDVDDSGLVDEIDLINVESRKGIRLGDIDFDPRYDVDANGRIDQKDASRITEAIGLLISVP